MATPKEGGQRPTPLWPEVLRKEGLKKGLTLPPVERQRTQAPTNGDTSFVPKQEAGSGGKKPDEQKQQPANPPHELSEYYRREQEQHSGVLKNPIRVQRPLPQNSSEQRRETEQSQLNPAEQQAAERLGKPPPEVVKGEVQQARAPHQEHPLDSLEEFRQLARRTLKSPVSPIQLEGIKPEDYEEWARNHPYRAANYATAMLYYEEAVEKLAQSMSEDPLQFTANIIRRYLREREERPKSPEE